MAAALHSAGGPRAATGQSSLNECFNQDFGRDEFDLLTKAVGMKGHDGIVQLVIAKAKNVQK